MPEPFPAAPLQGRAMRLAPSSPLEREGGELQAPSLRLTPIPVPPAQGGRGEQAASFATCLTLRDAFIAASRVLRDSGIDTPELDARLLLCHAAAISHEACIARAGEALPPAAAARFGAAIARRLAHEPVARIVGTREFYGRSFRVDPHVLDPRADTETLIEAALAVVDQQGWRERPLRLLDLGTGTGCILLTLLAELPRAQGIGTDMSPAALACAAANAGRLGVAARAGFIAANWLDAACGRFDLILANPPYIASSEIAGLAPDVAGYDPPLALDGGPDGLEAYREIAARVGGALAEQGRLLLEIGQTQADAVAEMLRGAGLEPRTIERDLAGRPRVVVAGW